ncbi:MAG: ATP-binding protein [Pseudomonadota bacterium]
MSHRVSLGIDSRVESVRFLRAAIRGLCDEAEVPASLISRVELCVAEAVCNAIEHAYARQTDRKIWVNWVRHDDTLAIRISDCGQSMATDLFAMARDIRLEVDPDDPCSLRGRGRGLALIHAFMTAVDYTSADGLNHLDMRLAIPQSPQSLPSCGEDADSPSSGTP